PYRAGRGAARVGGCRFASPATAAAVSPRCRGTVRPCRRTASRADPEAAHRRPRRLSRVDHPVRASGNSVGGVSRLSISGFGQILLDESWTQVHVHLHQRRISNAAEAVNLAGFDDQDISRAGLEFGSIHVPETAPLPNELDLI